MIVEPEFNRILRIAVEENATWCLFKGGLPPMLLVKGHLQKVGGVTLQADDVEHIVANVLTVDQWRAFGRSGGVDFEHTVRHLGTSFGITVYRTRGHANLIARPRKRQL